jgi:IS5 family transposase
LVAGLFILKHMENLSDEVLCERWVENPYYQFFCGELSFPHQAPFDRSSMTRWRQRLGEEQLDALLQESLSVAHKTGALESKDLERVVVDTTVQPKAVAHPTDARLMLRALEKLGAFAKREGHCPAPDLSAGGQACRHHGRPLQPCPSVQARRPGAQVPQHPARPRHP